MRAYRVDQYLGAVTEYVAVFADKREAKEYVDDSRFRDCLGIVDIEVPDDFWNQCFNEVSEE